eukprot:10497455-Alexandrium_andersonii.AAC.1
MATGEAAQEVGLGVRQRLVVWMIFAQCTEALGRRLPDIPHWPLWSGFGLATGFSLPGGVAQIMNCPEVS